ncbi:MAG: 2-amino-4-hydroxy-6-hydroxymethyldihydropteridine diphosphokinase [Clostridia bacterium]|nr:2-amino-4-hydroxy-6-hydroxymethyldihydropteridine diphosphokinase [Clostridia bacterium]
MTIKKAYIGIGTNLGNKESNLRVALQKIAALPQVKITKTAAFYRTAPVGPVEQDWFLNTAAEIETEEQPLELLENLLSIENQMGRVRTIHWGPRVIDLDLLAYADLVVQTEKLTLPHPYIKDRSFVLLPLAEICPDLELPQMGVVRELLQELEKNQVRA